LLKTLFIFARQKRTFYLVVCYLKKRIKKDKNMLLQKDFLASVGAEQSVCVYFPVRVSSHLFGGKTDDSYYRKSELFTFGCMMEYDDGAKLIYNLCGR
jgi:hypothetical protein